MRRARLLLGVLPLVAVLTATGPGAAGWTTPGSGAGRTAARTLPAPSNVQAACFVALVGRVDVTWTVPADALPGTTYVVSRSSDAGATWTTVGSRSAAPYTVSDTPPDGAHRYRVTAQRLQWSRAAASDSPTRTLLLVNLLRVCL